MTRKLLVLVFGVALACAKLRPGDEQELSWWKGNTHTHTLWSDGDGAPELVADWYRVQGYDFLVLSDHNLLSQGERWFSIDETGRLSSARVDELRATFGEAAVDVRLVEGGGREMRLATFDELRERFERPGEFLFLQGEEVSAAFEGAPVHLNGLNLAEPIDPITGTDVVDTIQRNIDAIRSQGQRLGRPVLAHLNHPNFRWAVTVDDLARIRGERFFEVYNGHHLVHNHGDATHLSTERMWDIALTLRLTELGLGLLYGLATDDTHNYFTTRPDAATGGRGWIHVRSAALDAESLLAAMHAGDFYASSGVELEDVQANHERMLIDIRAESALTYTTQFIGTRRGVTDRNAMGELLLETTADPAVYRFRGDELYVRAKVVSSRPHPNPHAVGDPECAWAQPVIVDQRSR